VLEMNEEGNRYRGKRERHWWDDIKSSGGREKRLMTTEDDCREQKLLEMSHKVKIIGYRQPLKGTIDR